MARNAVKKLRTLRHPGVIKVLDTVEVISPRETIKSNIRSSLVDRNIHLHCYREGHPITMAYQTEEHERGDFKMGFIWSSSAYLDPALDSHSTKFFS